MGLYQEETGRIRPDVNELYLPQTKEAACLAEGAEEVGVHVWMWMDSEMDAITFHDAELEADMALTDSMETGGLMLSRLTPFTRMLEAEGEEYDLSLDVHMLPQVMLRIYCLGTDYIMEIGCKLMDMERGSFGLRCGQSWRGMRMQARQHFCAVALTKIWSARLRIGTKVEESYCGDML